MPRPGTKLKRQPMLAKVCYSGESRPAPDVLNTSVHDSMLLIKSAKRGARPLIGAF